MDAGVGYMNELTVLQASQGLARYLQAEGIADRGVVVGFDHRAHGGLSSRAFAERTVAVLASQGIPVYFFRDLVPTPLVPIALLELNAAAGVMVTASHNPGADNGFKVSLPLSLCLSLTMSVSRDSCLTVSISHCLPLSLSLLSLTVSIISLTIPHNFIMTSK